MKILVTGASGFVGRHLAAALMKGGHEIILTGAHPATDLENFYKLDLAHEGEMAKFPLEGVDFIFHLAGLAAVGPSFHDPKKYISVNSGVQINLFEAFKEVDNKPGFLIISTGGVYAPSANTLTEESSVGYFNPYVISKLTQEMLGKYYRNLGFKVMIARPFNHAGPGQGEGFLIADLAKQICEAERAGGGTIQVGNLDSKRDYSDVRDIVRAYISIMEKGEDGETYNVCSGVSISGKEILDKFIAIANCEIKIHQDSSRIRPSENPSVKGDFSKLHRQTGWAPAIALEQTLKDVLNDWRSRK
jgi:GDP-4-dehydro-6-deoxy-D-mannose reductase